MLGITRRRRSVGAFDERGIKRDALGGEVEVQLDGVVAGFVVDIDGAGEFRGVGIVQPVVIGLPAIGGGDKDDVAGSVVFEGVFLPLVAGKDFGDAGLPAEECGYAADRGRISIFDEDV